MLYVSKQLKGNILMSHTHSDDKESNEFYLALMFFLYHHV
jgi:hypothetical protein